MEAPDLTNLFPGLSPEQTESMFCISYFGEMVSLIE